MYEMSLAKGILQIKLTLSALKIPSDAKMKGTP